MTEHPSLEANRRASRRAKQRRTGICEDCGTVTRYNGHADAVSRLCNPCASKRTGVAARGTGPVQTRALALLSARPMRSKEIAAALGRPQPYMGQLLGRMLEYGLIERVSRGVYRKVAA